MKRRRVLIVDDREDNALSLAAILSAVGYETSVATGGHAALEIADAERPDAVVLDLGLPDLSGYEVCRRLRAQSWCDDVLIIALTGWTRESDREAAGDVGFDHYVLKPATFETLDALLQGVERRGGPGSA